MSVIEDNISRISKEQWTDEYQQGRADIISQLRELEKENYCPCQQGNCMYEVSEFSCVTCYLNKIEQSLR